MRRIEGALDSNMRSTRTSRPTTTCLPHTQFSSKASGAQGLFRGGVALASVFLEAVAPPCTIYFPGAGPRKTRTVVLQIGCLLPW